MPKILIVEDDVELANVLEVVMREDGWSAEKAYTGADAIQFLEGFKFDLVILDWGLPDMSGIDVCRKFRNSGGQTPIIFLTARNAYPDKELGFGSGGDEYITKPFDNRELVLRIRAMMRRPAHLVAETLTINGATLDRKGKRLVAGDKNVQLSATEFAIIEFLFINEGTFYTANQLFEALWPTETETTSEVVRVHIKVLRRKLELIGLEDVIRTVRGAGYIAERNKQCPEVPDRAEITRQGIPDADLDSD
jgi:two-component system OmpR family response regulator